MGPGRMCRGWPSRRCGVLVRSAQSENPERFVLIDIDGDEASWGALGGALASGEPQLAVREGVVLAPRLARVGRGVLEAPAGCF